MKNPINKLFVGEIEIPDKFTPGLLKTHDYVSFQIAPSANNDNTQLDTLIKSFGSIKNSQLFKHLKDGQPVIAFELYADYKESYYMLTVPEKQKVLFKERLDSAFEGGGIKEYTHVGWPFVEYDKDTLIATVSLSKESFFPLLMDDSMICKEMLHVTEDLKINEKAFVQFLIEPIDEGWQNELERMYEAYIKGRSEGTTGGWLKSGGRMLDQKISSLASSLSDEDMVSTRTHRQIKEVNQKFRQNGYNVSIRIVANAPSYDRRNDIVEGLAGAIKGSNFYNSWQLTPVIRKKKTSVMIMNRQPSLLGSSNLLCEDELKVLCRFPTRDVVTKRLKRMKPDENKVDERITRDVIPIGRSIEFGGTGSRVGFSIADDDTASKARLFIAPPGSGKTTLVQTFKNGAMNAGHGGSIFDIADGGLYYNSIESTPLEKRHRLILVNFADEEHPHIFNFSSLGRDSDTIGAMFAEFFEVYYKTASNHRMNSLLRKTAMTSFANPDSTFLELIMLMRDEDYRRKFLPLIRKDHPDLFLWWKTDFPKIAKSESQMSEILQPILYRLDNLQYNKRLGPIFCGRGGKLDIYNWINQGKWVLYNLSNGVFLENEQRMLMSFLNYAYWTATLQRETLLRAGKKVVVHHKMYDEPQTYMNATPIFELSISKSRKYRVSDNFFIQNPSQVISRNEALWQQIIGMNPHILVGGGLDIKNLKIMAQELNVTIEELKQLEQLEYHWYFKTYVGKSALPPFIFDASGMPTMYGRDRGLERRWKAYFAPHSVSMIKEEIQARNLRLTIEEYRKLIETYDEPDDEEGVLIGED